jgi:autoinducer 2-degrading protein
MIAVWVSVKVKPEHKEDFLKAIEEDSRGSREDEPGCFRFDVLQDAEDPNRYYFYEVYKDKDAQLAHRAAPHYQAWAAIRDSGKLDGPPVITTVTTVFPVDSAWKK